jgi:amino acid permease
MALGGAIGIGLVIGTGTALRQGEHRHFRSSSGISTSPQGGPLGLLLGYSFVGASPHMYASRSLVDQALGLIWYAAE